MSAWCEANPPQGNYPRMQYTSHPSSIPSTPLERALQAARAAVATPAASKPATTPSLPPADIKLDAVTSKAPVAPSPPPLQARATNSSSPRVVTSDARKAVTADSSYRVLPKVEPFDPASVLDPESEEIAQAEDRRAGSDYMPSDHQSDDGVSPSPSRRNASPTGPASPRPTGNRRVTRLSAPIEASEGSNSDAGHVASASAAGSAPRRLRKRRLAGRRARYDSDVDDEDDWERRPRRRPRFDRRRQRGACLDSREGLPQFDIDADNEDEFPSMSESSGSEPDKPDFTVDADEEDWDGEAGNPNNVAEGGGKSVSRSGSEARRGKLNEKRRRRIITRSALRRQVRLAMQREEAERRGEAAVGTGSLQKEIPVIIIDDSENEGGQGGEVFVISDSEPPVSGLGKKDKAMNQLTKEKFRSSTLEHAKRAYTQLKKKGWSKIAKMKQQQRGVLYIVADQMGISVDMSRRKHRFLRVGELTASRQEFKKAAIDVIEGEIRMPCAVEVAREREDRRKWKGDKGAHAHNFVKSFAGRASVAPREIGKLVREGEWDTLSRLFRDGSR